MEIYKMWIGGKWVDADSGKTFAVVNPATEEELAQIPLGGKADVDKAVEAARKAFPIWSKKSQAERSTIVNKIAIALREHAREFEKLETLEHGTPAEDAKHTVVWAANIIEFNAGASRALTGDVIPILPNKLTYVQREPVGVCALITPWNNPTVMIAAKLAPALAAGNTCIIKPPSINSLIGLKLAELLSKIDDLPPGTVNIITGPGSSVGMALASHLDVDLIAFTGSSETGKSIMAVTSQTVKRFVVELGGKNPIIIFEDADIDAAIKIYTHRQFHNSGQICAAPGRYYVHEDVYDEFVGKYLVEAKKVVVGDPTDVKTTMGPVVSAEHRDKVEYYIKSGVHEGATLLLGGERPATAPLNKGFFIMPTVFTNVTQNMKIAREEIFGPVACIMKFKSEDDVIALANDNVYGLSASVWTRDLAKGIRCVNELHAGTVWLNTQILTPELPWGGVKESGIGKDGAMVGLKEFTTLKLVCMDVGE